MGDQTIAVDSMADAVRSPEENAEIAENTADVSANVEQTADIESDTSPEEGLNTTDEDTGEHESSDQSIPYSRFQQVIAEKNEFKAKAELLDKIQSDPQYASQLLNRADPSQPVTQEQQVKQALKNLGVPEMDDVKSIIREQLEQERVYREIDQKVNNLQKEWDGKDGKPKFDVEAVVEYGQKTGIYDPEAAFKLLHEKELAEFYSKQSRKSGVKSERQGKPVQNVGKDEDALRSEAQKTGDWTKFLQNRL